MSALAVKIINKIKYDKIKQNYIKLRHLWSKNKDEDKMNENLKKKRKWKCMTRSSFRVFPVTIKEINYRTINHGNVCIFYYIIGDRRIR